PATSAGKASVRVAVVKVGSEGTPRKAPAVPGKLSVLDPDDPWSSKANGLFGTTTEPESTNGPGGEAVRLFRLIARAAARLGEVSVPPLRGATESGSWSITPPGSAWIWVGSAALFVPA